MLVFGGVCLYHFVWGGALEGFRGLWLFGKVTCATIYHLESRWLATPMYWFIIAPYKSPPFGSCAIYFQDGVNKWLTSSKWWKRCIISEEFNFNVYLVNLLLTFEYCKIEHLKSSWITQKIFLKSNSHCNMGREHSHTEKDPTCRVALHAVPATFSFQVAGP